MHIILRALALIAVSQPAFAADAKLSAADTAAAFKAGGFTQRGKQWQACGDPGSMSYSPGVVELVRDLNGDGRLEAVLTETSTACYGMTGTGFSLVSKQADGKWKRMAGGQGMASFLATKGVGGWPDIEIGGPGFCFPVQRWNGKEYVYNRSEYEGKRCRPN